MKPKIKEYKIKPIVSINEFPNKIIYPNWKYCSKKNELYYWKIKIIIIYKNLVILKKKRSLRMWLKGIIDQNFCFPRLS